MSAETPNDADPGTPQQHSNTVQDLLEKENPMNLTLEQRLRNLIAFMREEAVCGESEVEDYCALEQALDEGRIAFNEN